MEKFIIASGTALRISDSGYGRTAAGKNPEGSKPTIVLLHGYLESLDVWDDFTKLLAPRLRVVSLDLPGHGVSEVKGEVHTMDFLADVVRGALEEQGIGKCVLAGHSMGGYAALAFLRKYPEMLDGFILFHSFPGADTPEKIEHRQREIEVVLSGKKDLLANTVAMGFAAHNRAKFVDAIADLSEQVVLTEEEGVVALLRGMSERADSNDMLRKSDVPQMFVLGRHDEYITMPIAEDMVARHPQAEVLWLDDSGHMGFIEEPQKSAEAIIDFCQRVSGIAFEPAAKE